MNIGVATTTFKSSEGEVEVGRRGAIHTHEPVWEERDFKVVRLSKCRE
jgi:hypothetical protein